MSRRPSPLLLYATLVTGIALGLAWGRVAPTLEARATGAPRGDRVEAAPGGHGQDAIDRELARNYERFQAIDSAFATVARAVAPAVVHIVARKTGRRDNGRAFVYEETGSGVIVRADTGPARYVLTNNHVIEGAAERDTQVFLHDGRAFRPERFWADEKTDIAVLKLPPNLADLPTARLGDSDEAAVGSWVLALGSPFGLTHSVTQGIISARMRHEDELENDGVLNQQFLQTDAAINPGNSGGPLVNMKGQVIGINTAIATEGGGSQGVGFSIPINLARWAMTQLVATGKVSRGALGVRLQTLEPQEAIDLGLAHPRGARIHSVQKGTPAEKAGLRVGDVVLRFQGTPVLNFNQLINLISMTPVNSNAEVVVWRDRREVTLRVGIIDRDVMMAQEPTEPEPARPGAPLRRPPRPAPAPELAASAMGLELATLDDAAAQRLGLPESVRGVVVQRVDPTSPLAAAIRPRDVINAVGGRAVRTADDLARALSGREDQPLDLVLQRRVDGVLRSLKVQVP